MPRSSVDEQVVKMSFDNSNFDQNIDKSIKALNSLENQLGILNKNNFGDITNSVNNLAKTFTVKGQVMLGVLTKLGNKIYDLGHTAFRKLTQGIKDGLSEYNLIIESTQTIFQNVKQSGASLQDVNDALDELNDYADKTIYNFSEMTRMIGMFTSAGVGLNRSVSTIKGLANAAALVGANSQKAEQAWHAVSRAMSAGRFTAITWRSLEYSNIAGKQLQKVITTVARVNKVTGKSGKNIDQMLKKYGTLRETLRENWLTKDVFTEAMDIMSGAMTEADLKKKGYTKKQIKELMAIAKAAEEAATKVKTFKQLMETTAEAIGSGWAQSFRILIGDLEDAKKLYTRISTVLNDFIDNNAEIRNEIFEKIVNGKDEGIAKNWKTGRENFRQIIENMLAIIKTFLKSVKTGFLNIFPIDRIAAAARKVLDIIQNLTRALVINNEELNQKGEITLWDTSSIENISNAVKDLIRFFRGLASAIDIAWMAFSQPFEVIVKRIPFLNNFFENTNSGIKAFINRLGKFGDRITVIRTAIKETRFFGAALEIFIDNIDEIGKKYPIIGAVVNAFNNLKKAIVSIKDNFKKLNIKPLNVLLGALKFVINAIWKALDSIFKLLKTAKNSIDWSWLEKPKQFLLKLLKTFSDYGKGVITFEDVTAKLGGSLSKLFNKIKTIFNSIKEKFSGNKLVTSVQEANTYYSKLNTTLDKTNGKVKEIWTKVKDSLKPLTDIFKNTDKNSNITFENFSKNLVSLGVGFLAASLGVSTLIKNVKKIKVLDNINSLLGSANKILKAYEKEISSKYILNIAIAIGILAAALFTMALIPYERMEDGLVIFTSFITVISTFLPIIVASFTKFNTSIQKISTGLSALMIGAMFIDLAIAIGILVGSIIVLNKAFGNSRKLQQAIDPIIQLINALAGLAVGIIIAIEAFTLFSKLMNHATTNTKKVVNSFEIFSKLAGVAIIIVSIAAATLILVKAIKEMTTIKSEDLSKCYGMIIGLLLILGGIASGISAAGSIGKGKLKEVTVSLTGTILAVAIVLGVMSKLMEQMQNDVDWGWAKTLTVFTGVIVGLGILASTMLLVGKEVSGKSTIWSKLSKYILVVASCVAILAGAIWLLGETKPIDGTVLATIGIITVAFLGIISLLALIAVAVTKTKGNFANKFIPVVKAITISIAAIVTSFGILMAGIGILIKSIAEIDNNKLNVNKASTRLIEKFATVALILEKSVPALKEIFYNVGKSIGSIFGSFFLGFAEGIAELGDGLNAIADRVVNVIIDLLGKVANILYSRKDEIAKIITQMMHFIAYEIAAVFNAFFAKSYGMKAIDAKKVLNFLGISAITIGLVEVVTKTIKILKTLGVKFDTVKKKASSFIEVLNKVGAKKGSTNVYGLKEYAAAVFAIGVAAEFSVAAIKGLNQMSGKEAQHIRSDITDAGELMVAFFTDANVRQQMLIYGITLLGKFIVTIFRSIYFVVKGIFQGLVWAVGTNIKVLVGIFADAMAFIDKNNAQHWKNIKETVTKTVDNLGIAAGDTFNQIKEDWSHLGDIDFGNNIIDDAKAYSYDWTDALTDSAVNGLDNYESTINTKLLDIQNNGILANMKNVLPGVIKNKVNGTSILSQFMPTSGSGNTGPTSDVLKSSNNSVIQEYMTHKNTVQQEETKVVDLYSKVTTDRMKVIASNGKSIAKAIGVASEEQYVRAKSGAEKVAQELFNFGITDLVNTARTLTVNAYDQESGLEKEVVLNRDLLDITIAQTKALEGKNREEAKAWILEEARNKGIVAEATDAYNIVDAIFANQDDKVKVAVSGVENLAKNTIASVQDVMGKSVAAEDMLISDTMSKYDEVMKIAEDHKEELVGKKKEEVEKILEQEAIKRGMTESEAKESAKLVTAQLYAGLKTEEGITQDSLEEKLNAYKQDYENFIAQEEAKTQYLDAQEKIRAKLVASGYYEQKALYDAGKITRDEWFAFQKDNNISSLIIQQKALSGAYIKKQQEQMNKIKSMYSDSGADSKKVEKLLKKRVNEYVNILGSVKSQEERGTYSSLRQALNEWLGKDAPDLDLDPWNKDKKKTTKKKKDKEDPVKAAKDLKTNLEKERADLTPTFDLDKLASDANKANGIVMSSLMAAQNASIGDYINQDSELNPFMKDRWQNVYNFTQNNYSPKALSRIDIYRQTQRQISMSRGF